MLLELGAGGVSSSMLQLTAFLLELLLGMWWLSEGTGTLAIPIGFEGSGGLGSGRASLDPDPNLQASFALIFLR